jgi:Ca2+-binding RTX toxin-like protein
MRGNEGDDYIEGNGGNDSIWGDAGNDTISGGEGNDGISGWDGNDNISAGKGDDAISDGAGDDYVRGDSGNDALYDGVGNDVHLGGSGDDVIYAGAGDDHYDGGSGYDTLDYSRASGNVVIDLSKKWAFNEENMDTFAGIERVVGTNQGDYMLGNRTGDELVGGAGGDYLRGKGGVDILTGGSGHDTYEFLKKDVLDASGHLGVDVITDFAVGDILDLHDFVKVAFDDISEHIRFTENRGGTTVSAKVGDAFVDVVHLEGVLGASASQMLADGFLIV